MKSQYKPGGLIKIIANNIADDSYDDYIGNTYKLVEVRKTDVILHLDSTCQDTVWNFDEIELLSKLNFKL